MRARIAPHPTRTHRLSSRVGTCLRMGLGLATMLGTAMAATAGPALASHITMSGDSVDLAAPCVNHILISVDPALRDGASLDSGTGAQVTIHDDKDGAENRIMIATRSCQPDGRLILRLAPDTGLSIHDSHDSRFTITGTLSSLDASLDSDTLDVARVQSLDLSMQGNSSVHIAALNRAAQIVASGTSRFSADNAQLSALSVQLTNNTTLNIGGGTIEALTVVAADQATATVLGTATVATVTANGGSVVNIEKVNGPLVRSGTGSVRVGAPNGEIYRPTPSLSAPLPPATAGTAPTETIATGATTTGAPQGTAAPQVPAQIPAQPSVPASPSAPPSVQTAPPTPAPPVMSAPVTSAPVTPAPLAAAPQPMPPRPPAPGQTVSPAPALTAPTSMPDTAATPAPGTTTPAEPAPNTSAPDAGLPDTSPPAVPSTASPATPSTTTTPTTTAPATRGPSAAPNPTAPPPAATPPTATPPRG